MNGKIALIILSFGVGLTSTFAHKKSAGVTFHGRIMDKVTHGSVNGEINIYFDNDFESESAKNISGEFSETLTKYGWYIITVNAHGYLEINGYALDIK
ncbi:MAG: hypothetical protein QM734_06975 [Cyclobacteriaceae bacterium]